MRILHLTDRVSDRGGAYRHLVGVVADLAARGCRQLLAAGEDDGRVRPACPTVLVRGLASRTRTGHGLDQAATGFRPDVVHVHTVMNPAALEWAASRAAVATVQDHRAFCPGRGKWTAAGDVCRDALGPERCAGCFDDRGYFEDVYALTLERLAALARMPVVVLSRYMRGELVAAGVPEDRVSVVPPFVHGLDPAAAPGGPACVLFVGRLVAGKGVWDAVAAWRASGLDLPLVFAGTGPLRRPLEAEGLEVLGWLDPQRLSAAYRRAAAVVMPSRWQEPFGIAGLEALSLGAPVAAWASGGVGEWHTGPGLVPWGDVAGLGRALAGVAGTRGRAPGGHDRAALMDRLVQVYNTVRGGGPLGRRQFAGALLG